MSEKLFAVLVFVGVGAFALLFRDAFVATVDFLDETRCSIGMEHYCKGTE